MSNSSSPSVQEAAAPCQPSSSSSSSSSPSSSSSSTADYSGYLEADPDPESLFPVTQASLLSRRLLRSRSHASRPYVRRKREMVPTDKKDSAYWDKRLKNNEAAKRSRERRRLSERLLEGQLLALSEENAQLRARVLGTGHCGVPRAFATSGAPVCASPGSPRPVHSAALFQPRLWGGNGGGGGPACAAVHPFEAEMLPRVGGFAPHGYYSCGAPRCVSPLFGPGAAALDGGRSARAAEMDAQRHVSSSDDVHKSTEAPGQLRHASILSRGNWLVPPLSPSAVSCNNFLLPWRSSYGVPAAVYPDLPLYIRETRGQGVGVEALMSRSPAVPTPLKMHRSPDAR
uniref:Si:dkey-172o19.2 n=1 Tax=Gasterosteus aculeatus aculeatus TaxID=481459 RepID=A0AAQ4PBC5_GASAC